jgi:protein TonB
VPIDDYPRGSGIARALVNASWQFKVRPPRINGIPEVGSWVRIRIEFSSKNKSD